MKVDDFKEDDQDTHKECVLKFLLSFHLGTVIVVLYVDFYLV